MALALARLLRRLANTRDPAAPTLRRKRVANQRHESAVTAPLTRYGPRSVTTLLAAAVLLIGVPSRPKRWCSAGLS